MAIIWNMLCKKKKKKKNASFELETLNQSFVFLNLEIIVLDPVYMIALFFCIKYNTVAIHSKRSILILWLSFL